MELKRRRFAVRLVQCNGQRGDLRHGPWIRVTEQRLAAVGLDKSIVADDLDEPPAIALDVRAVLDLVGLVKPTPVAVGAGPRPKINAASVTTLPKVGAVLVRGT